MQYRQKIPTQHEHPMTSKPISGDRPQQSSLGDLLSYSSKEEQHSTQMTQDCLDSNTILKHVYTLVDKFKLYCH